MVRVLTYLPGIPIAKIPSSPQILYEAGRSAATLDKVLQGVCSDLVVSVFLFFCCCYDQEQYGTNKTGLVVSEDLKVLCNGVFIYKSAGD